MSVIYGPSFTRRTRIFMYYPFGFLWFICAYFCKLKALRLNDTEKVNITHFFLNTPVRENYMNSLRSFYAEEQMNRYDQVSLLTSFEL